MFVLDKALAVDNPRPAKYLSLKLVWMPIILNDHFHANFALEPYPP